MDTRVTIPKTGDKITVETISTLEDIWHDFQFFKGEGARLEGNNPDANDLFTIKRFQRAALLMLVFYLEGVLNYWLKQLLPNKEWSILERKCIELKIDALQKRVGTKRQATLSIEEAKKIRNSLAHIKPRNDLALYDMVDRTVLESTEANVNDWLTGMERLHGMRRHPDTAHESRWLTEALGTNIPGTEGYSGKKKTPQ